MGTDAAILQLVNIMEDADDSGTPKFLSSWGIQKVFASSSCSGLTLAWHRLRVPLEVAEYLVSLEKGDSTVIRSPIVSDSKRYTAFRQYKSKPDGRSKGPGTRPAKFS